MSDDVDLLYEVGKAYHDAAIVVDDHHPDVPWERCTAELCVQIREALVRLGRLP